MDYKISFNIKYLKQQWILEGYYFKTIYHPPYVNIKWPSVIWRSNISLSYSHYYQITFLDYYSRYDLYKILMFVYEKPSSTWPWPMLIIHIHFKLAIMKIGSIEEGIRNIKTTFISCKICTDDYRHQIVPNHKNSGWNVLFKKSNWHKKK